MHVIRHDNGDVEEILNIILVQTALQRDRASRIGQEPSMKCTECDKVALVIALQMRKFASIESHGPPGTT